VEQSLLLPHVVLHWFAETWQKNGAQVALDGGEHAPVIARAVVMMVVAITELHVTIEFKVVAVAVGMGQGE
jgi:hypothetical protein